MGITIYNFRVGHIDIQYGWQNSPNSVGGVSLGFYIENTGATTIKYVTLRCIPYNAVGDAVADTISGLSELALRLTGPLEVGKRGGYTIENGWYNPTITSVKIRQAEIEYMDGSTEVIPGDEIPMETTGGCYVATAIYGSYDCPQVWTLRRFRDGVLSRTWYGRLFIRFYYALSPGAVRLFGRSSFFQRFFRPRLDKLVSRLQAHGFSAAPYEDK